MGDFVAYPPLVIVPPAETTSICLNKDGSEIFAGLVTGRGQGRLIVYDAHTGNELIELKVFDKPTLSIALTIDDKRLVAVDEAGTVHVWRRENERWISDKSMQLEGQPRAVFCSRYGERVVAWVGPALDVWNVASGSKIKSLPIDPGWRIGNAAFDLPQRRLVASYMDEDSDSVGWALWDLDAGADQPAHMVEMPSLGDTYANDVDIAPGSDQMAIGFDEALLVYGLRDFQRINFYGVDSTKAVAFSPTNPYLAATNIRGWITVWNSVTNRPLATLHHPRQSASRDDLAFSADGTHLASSNANSIQVWNLAKADEKTIMAGHRGGIPCAAFHPDGRLLATGGKDDEVRIWNSSTGQLVQSINLREAVQALAYSPDGQLLAVGCMGRAGAPHLRVFDTQTAEKIYEAGPNSGEIHSLSWAKGAGGDYLAACGPENVTLWRASTGRPLQLEQDFQLDRSRCLSTALGANGQWMVWAENDSQLGAWDVEENQERPLHAPQMLQGWHGVAFLPDGESIVYITKSGVAEVWNVKQDRHVDAVGMPGTFSAPQLALSPDGKWLAAVVQQSMVSVWRMPTKEHVFSVRPDAGTIWSLAWDPSSRQLAVGQSDGGLAVWHLPKIQEKLGESGLRWQDAH
jgi:WD40 repeat protein